MTLDITLNITFCTSIFFPEKLKMWCSGYLIYTNKSSPESITSLLPINLVTYYLNLRVTVENLQNGLTIFLFLDEIIIL